MIEALIAGESDPAKLAQLADRRVKASQQTLREALRGRVTEHHRFLLRLHLDQIDALDAAIAKIDQEVEAGIAPFRTAVEQVGSVPGVKNLAAQQILSEIGTDMSRFASDAISSPGPASARVATRAQASVVPAAFALCLESGPTNRTQSVFTPSRQASRG